MPMTAGTSDNDPLKPIRIPRSALRGSPRVARESTPLIRGGITEQPEEELIEIPAPANLGKETDPVRVLHVDDDPEIVEVTQLFLERINEDFTVLSETSVVAALDRLGDEDVDCIVSDYEMPNTDGLEFLQIVRERYPDLPFILFTGKGSEEIASKAIAADVTDYMQKGARSDQYEVLANRVENAVEQYRTQQQFWNALSWYQRLVEQELAGVFIVQDGEFVYVNEKLADIFEYGQTELIGQSPLTIVTERDHDLVTAELIEHEETPTETFQYQFTGQRSDETELDIEIHGGAIEYDGGPACIGILRHVGDHESDIGRAF